MSIERVARFIADLAIITVAIVYCLNTAGIT